MAEEILTDRRELPTAAGFIDLAGRWLKLDINGRPVILAHGDDGQIRVLMNTCRHRGNLVAPHATFA